MKLRPTLHKVVFVRHGQSEWNLQNRFTGWHDVDLTDQGVYEAKSAGILLRERGYQFDVAHTSMLTRAIKTYNNIVLPLGTVWLPHYKTWRLNERHYGALQGLNKAETAEKHGEAQVMEWRRSYSTPPPGLAPDDERHPRFDRRYSDLHPEVLPATESLETCGHRVLPYWYDNISPHIMAGQNVIVVAHGNSLRAIVKHLAGMNEAEILKYSIPTGCPLVFEFDENLKPL